MTDTVELKDCRPAVQRFAVLMEKKLRTHDGNRGFAGWRNATPAELQEGVHVELDELDVELSAGNWKAVAAEAVDTANFCMMIADNCGALADVDQLERAIAEFDEVSSREAEIRDAFMETPPYDRDSSDNAIGELLEIIDAGRERVKREVALCELYRNREESK